MQVFLLFGCGEANRPGDKHAERLVCHPPGSQGGERATPRGATRGSAGVGQEAREIEGKHEQEPAGWFLRERQSGVPRLRMDPFESLQHAMGHRGLWLSGTRPWVMRAGRE